MCYTIFSKYCSISFMEVKMGKQFNKEEAIENLKVLLDRYSENHDHYISSNYNESECRLEFIDKLLEYFGWDVQNNSGKKPQNKEVLVESYEQDLGKPDYTMTLNGKSVFFVEAKKPHVNILTDKSCCFQAKRYGWSAKHKMVLLTNFEDLIIYDSSVMPTFDDNTNSNLIGRYHYTDYLSKYDEIYSLISKEIVYDGTFDKKFGNNTSLGLNVDDVFLKQINEWRLELGTYLYEKEKNIKNINLQIQTLINQIIFLRICEDRDLPLYKTLQKSILDENTLQVELGKLLNMANKRYNSGIFKEKDLLKTFSNSILKNIIGSLYYPVSPYDFTVISSNILGEIYELFLTETLVEENGTIKLQAKKDNINRSIVATPYDIVKYMTEKALGKMLEHKTPDDIKKMKFADIACGSGIFLTSLLEYLINYCENWYKDNKHFEYIEETYTNSYKLKYKEKKDLLLSCIYGNDVDYQAVEVAKFSLLLKVLEGENKESVLEVDPILPSLDLNIINGNSLVDFDMISEDSDNYIKIKPFSWKNINSDCKFDLIIGNPPYVKTEDMINLLSSEEVGIYKAQYYTAYKQFDKYFLFIERAIHLLNDGGKLCYIVPNKFMKIGSGRNLRDLISKNKYLELLIDFNYQQIFEDKTTYTCIILLDKNQVNSFEYNYIQNYEMWKLNNINEENTKIDIDEIGSEPWILSTDLEKMNSLKKLFANSIPLSQIATPFNGVQTSLNSLYVIKGREVKSVDDNYLTFKKGKKTYKIERSIIKRYFQPATQSEKNVKTFDPLVTDKYIIFPYDKNGNLIDLNDYQKFREYVTDFYDEIVPKQVSGKKQGRDVPNSNEDNWYQYGRTQALTEFNNQEKLIVGVMSRDPMFMYDNNNLVIQSGGTAGYCGIKMNNESDYNLYFLQAYLSHPLMTNVMECLGSDFEGGFYSRGTQVLNKLPIVNIDFSNDQENKIYNQIVTDVMKIHKLNDELMKNSSIENINITNRVKDELVRKINNNITKLIDMKG